MQGNACVVWCITDNKPGHHNQLRGLTMALQRELSVQVHWLAPLGPTAAVWNWLRRRFPAGRDLPDPTLVLAAGHATHWAALAARRARGGKLILLMRPTLPLEWFDLCIVPEHDSPPQAPNIIVTQGVLNAIEAGRPQPGRGLFLIGGPSRHHQWSDSLVANQVNAIVSRETHRTWRLTTSRRTPVTLLSRLPRAPNLDVIPVDQTDRDWVPRELSVAEHVWVTEDSVSMVYEALTAGASVGILPVPRRHSSRVVRGLDRLRAQGWVTGFADWEAGQSLRPPPQPLAEADRCAHVIYERFLR
ncbi:MAG: mitochondrial fission ELM1 family protein [Verrucomicrobiae bacterium]|nr:mitochondrial fission ELM1 family protein [Verrucomicrobiae bacterium]MDW8343819.1 ELM1/GtrOC1 family putative glycosyltransferase [Verrucomicrobiae bacterium]